MIQSTDFYLLSLQPVKPVAWPQFRDELLADYGRKRAPMTTAKMRQVLDILSALNLAGDGEGPRTIATTEQLDLMLVKRFVEAIAPGRATITLKSLLVVVQTICSHAEQERRVMVSPFRLRRVSRWVGRVPKPTGKRHNTPREIRAVLDLMKADIAGKRGWAQWRARRLYALVSTVAYSGLRAKEAQRLHVEDLDLDGGVIEVVPHTRTGLLKTDDSAQPVAAPAALVAILRDWLEHRLDHPAGFGMPPLESIPWLWPGARRIGPWLTGKPGYRPINRLTAVARRAGVEGMTFQSLRRSWATIAEARGVPQALITRQCRHTSEQTTKLWYQQRDMAALRDALEGFDF